MQRCQSNKQLGLDHARTLKRSRSRGCISGYVIAKMAWNGKHPLSSASRSLLENFEFFAYACLWVQYPIECCASSSLNHCKRFSHYWASLAEERKKEERRKKKEEDTCRRFGHLANYRLGTPVMISINANSLVVDENTREWLVWLIKASDYI